MIQQFDNNAPSKANQRQTVSGRAPNQNTLAVTQPAQQARNTVAAKQKQAVVQQSSPRGQQKQQKIDSSSLAPPRALSNRQRQSKSAQSQRSSNQGHSMKIDEQARMSQQYGLRRPVSILKAKKREHYLNELGTTEMLEESYLWDQDQPKDQSAQRSVKIMEKRDQKKGALLSGLERGNIESKKKKRHGGSAQSQGSQSQEGDKKKGKDSEPLENETQDIHLDPYGQLGQLRTHDYFHCQEEKNLDSVMKKVKQVKGSGGAGVGTNIMNSIAGFFQTKTDATDEDDPMKNFVQPAKKTIQWEDVSASCAYGDHVILGFGNGSLVILNTGSRVLQEDEIVRHEKDFSAQDKPIDKLKVVYIDEFSEQAEDHPHSEILLYSLSGGQVNIHKLPSLEKMDICHQYDVLDFEPYKNVDPKPGKISYKHFIAMLFWDQGNAKQVLKIFWYDIQQQKLDYLTKVAIKGQDKGSKQIYFPVFDGGIAVHQDTFAIQYKDSALFIKIQTNPRFVNEYKTVTRVQINTGTQNKQDEEIVDERMKISTRKLHVAEDGAENEEEKKTEADAEDQFQNKKLTLAERLQGTLAKQRLQNEQFVPTPVFDEFLQAFIITMQDRSFYLDLNGNYDLEFKQIKWGHIVFKVQIANPYIIGYLTNSSIEVRNIFNPNKIFRRIKLAQSQEVVTACVAQNLLNKQKRMLEDFYMITKEQDMETLSTKQSAKKTEIFTLVKFKQDMGDNQLKLLHDNEQYSTFLKFQDFLRDHNLQGGLTSPDIYSAVLAEKAFYNFIIKKRFVVTSDIVFRYLVPFPQVIALFSFIYHEGYFHRFEGWFSEPISRIEYLWMIQRIKIYHYPVDTKPKRFGKKKQHEAEEKEESIIKKKNNQLLENEEMRKEMRGRIDLNIKQTIFQFNERKKMADSRRDPHYINQELEPTKQLSHEQLDSIRMFLPFFIKQRLYLQKRYLQMHQVKIQPSRQREPTRREKQEENEQVRYYRQYEKPEEIRRLLQYTEMIVFHTLILLMNSQEKQDQNDKNLYKKEFQLMLEDDFSEQIYHQEVRRVDQSAKEGLQKRKTATANTDRSQEEKEHIYEDPVSGKTKVRLQLPPFFCLDTFFKYRMYDEACQYIYYRREFNQLCQLIRLEYQQNQEICKKLYDEIISKSRGMARPGPHGGQQDDQQNTSAQNKIEEELKEKRKAARKFREDWKMKHIKYQQKINDIQPFETEMLREKAWEDCAKQSDWMFKEEPSKWVECFKLSSNIKQISQWCEQKKLSRLEKQIKSKEEFKCDRPPFVSLNLLQEIQQKGGILRTIKYLEYLTLKCNIQETSHHNELGCLYIQCIENLLRRHDLRQRTDDDLEPQEDAQSEDSTEMWRAKANDQAPPESTEQNQPSSLADPGDEYDYKAASKDPNIIKNSNIVELRNKLRDFILSSKHYDPQRIYDELKDKGEFLNKEFALIKMRLRLYKESFDICINQIEDENFIHLIAKKGFEWHNSDRRIYYNLFKKLMSTGDAEYTKQAKQVLVKYCKYIPHEKISKNFADEEVLDLEMYTLYESMFIQMESKNVMADVQKNLTELEQANLELERFNYQTNTSFTIDGAMCCVCKRPLIDQNKGLEEQPFEYDPVRQVFMHGVQCVNQR